jgi:hypothetical protein
MRAKQSIPFSTREFQPALRKPAKPSSAVSVHLKARRIAATGVIAPTVLFQRDVAPQIMQPFAQNARVGVTASVRKLPRYPLAHPEARIRRRVRTSASPARPRSIMAHVAGSGTGGRYPPRQYRA